MKLTLPALAILAFAFSCSGNKTETADQRGHDSTTTTTTVTAQAPASYYNPADSGTFKGLVGLFETPQTRLPDWAKEFISDDGGGSLTTEKILHRHPAYLFLCIKFEPVGPGVDALHAVSFNQDGTLLSDVRVGESYPSAGPDGGGKDFNYSYDESKKVMKVSDISIEWSEEDQQDVINEVWFYYYLDGEGKIIPGREYPQVSQRVLSEEDLTSYSTEQLKIMRNEIFASYGYIFKTEPLKSYFASQPWYTAENENVDEYLTEKEKANVALIKHVESQK